MAAEIRLRPTLRSMIGKGPVVWSAKSGARFIPGLGWTITAHGLAMGIKTLAEKYHHNRTFRAAPWVTESVHHLTQDNFATRPASSWDVDFLGM